jgi:hypothetical protein
VAQGSSDGKKNEKIQKDPGFAPQSRKTFKKKLD